MHVTDLFIKKLTSLGFHSVEFGLHGLRSGGATTAENAGAPDRLFKRHSRWKSENTKDGYSVESRLQVSKKLGLYPYVPNYTAFFVALSCHIINNSQPVVVAQTKCVDSW